MSREWSIYDVDWPSLIQPQPQPQPQPPYANGRPSAPRPPADAAVASTSGSADAGRCMPAASPYLGSWFYPDQNLSDTRPAQSAYQQPSMHNSMALTSPGPSHYQQMYSPHLLHQQIQMQRPHALMPIGEVASTSAAAAAHVAAPKGDSPRVMRNKAEKQRRDKLNQSIAELANMVPPVVAASRKIDKTGILRLTAHYLRANQYVFGDSGNRESRPREISAGAALAFLEMVNGFLITCTYKGIIVVISKNVQKYLGYTELELVGHNIMMIVHEDDRSMLLEQLKPKSHLLGPHGELLLPDDPEGRKKVIDSLNEKRNFVIRLKKLTQRSQTQKYVTCHVDGSLRKADRACRGYNRCCQMVRRARARGDNPCSSGNDVVFVGMVRPTTESFVKERQIENFRMEYRTRHSIDGQILQTEQRISLIAGYMMSEVNGLNAMNFMHRDDVRFVVSALKEMYNHRRLCGDSCYRLMTKNGQFIYLKTQGQLEVDETTKAITTFVCTNTVVDEVEGTHLINLMKKKCAMITNIDDMPPENENPNANYNGDSQTVEDPKQLEAVIMHLVSNISSPKTDDGSCSSTPGEHSSSILKLAIIPPRRDHIVNAIEKIYGIIKINSMPNTTTTSSSYMNFRSFQEPTLNEINSNTIKIQELPNGEVFHFKAQTPPKPKATSFEECFLNLDENGEYKPSSFIPKVSDQVLGAVQLGKNDGCHVMNGQTVGLKRSIDGDNQSHTFKRKTYENEMNKDDANEMKPTNSVFGDNELEALLADNGIGTELDTDPMSLLQSIGDTNVTSSSFPDLLGAEFDDLFENLGADNLQDGNNGPKTME